MIRFASFNQILDPWVYILLRRELVWKVIQGIKYIFGVKPKETECEISLQKSNISRDQESDTCCWFCFHCLCDPPVKQRQRSESLFSTNEYELRKSTIISRTPTFSTRMETIRNGKKLVSRGSDRELNELLVQLQKSKQEGKC